MRFGFEITVELCIHERWEGLVLPPISRSGYSSESTPRLRRDVFLVQFAFNVGLVVDSKASHVLE